MADTVENKQEIREVIRLLSKKVWSELYEDTILKTTKVGNIMAHQEKRHLYNGVYKFST